jgi:NitT/TauT family transport system ATP-binding protein
VFQNDRLLPWRSAIQNVELGLEMLDLPKPERRATAQLWLTRLGLAGHEHDFPHALSGGMRQRVSIARAFATNAGILLCDEPFSALDEIDRGSPAREFVRLVKENGKTAVFITHSISEALEIGDRIVVMKRPAMIAYDVSFDSQPQNLLSILEVGQQRLTRALDETPRRAPARIRGRPAPAPDRDCARRSRWRYGGATGRTP